MSLQDPRNLESFESMWNRATAKPFVPEQYPGYREIWPELATKPAPPPKDEQDKP